MMCQQWVCGSFQGQLSCVYVYWVLLFGILSRSPLVSGEMNQAKSVWVVHFVICLSSSACAGHASGSALHAGGVLCSPPVLCASLIVCTPLVSSYSSTPESNTCLAGSPGCASPFPGWWRSSVLPLSYSLSAFFHGPFPSHNPCCLLPMQGLWGFLPSWGKSRLMNGPLQLWQGQLLNCGIQRVQCKQEFPLCLIPQ